MAGWTVSVEAVKALDEINNNLEILCTDISRETNTVIVTFEECKDGLGAHVQKIQTLVEEIKEQSINAEKLAQKLRLKVQRAIIIRKNHIEKSRYKSKRDAETVATTAVLGGTMSRTVSDNVSDPRNDDTYSDDNGQVYRQGNDLVTNGTYVLNGYTYRTDGNGRIESVEGNLHIRERNKRLPIRDSLSDIGKGDELPGDDRGHLIGDRFDGSNGLENMIPQNANINRIDFRNLEDELARQVKSGKTVDVEIEPIYEEKSRRPKFIIVTYIIDGDENVRIFPNNKE